MWIKVVQAYKIDAEAYRIDVFYMLTINNIGI